MPNPQDWTSNTDFLFAQADFSGYFSQFLHKAQFTWDRVRGEGMGGEQGG